jgi:hypothetical protein
MRAPVDGERLHDAIRGDVGRAVCRITPTEYFPFD